MVEDDSPVSLEIRAVVGMGEIAAGDDLAELLAPLLAGLRWADGATGLRDGDVVAVSSKIVSKSEGRIVQAADREAAITAETVRVVASRTSRTGVLRIVENYQGLVMAAAGVDASNTPEGTVLLLPRDPDRSARVLRTRLEALLGVRIGVVVTDTAGRAWREGLTDIAIGAAGLQVLDDLRGKPDTHGRTLTVTVTAVADEVASATELVRGKSAGRPVAVVRGLGRHVIGGDGPGARSLQRRPEDDLFSLGTAEALAAGRAAAHACQDVPADAAAGATVEDGAVGFGTATEPADGAVTTEPADGAVTAGRSDGWWLVVPVKGGAGKSRLAVVEPGLRAELARAFALDTLRAAARSQSVRCVLAVTDDDELARAVAGLDVAEPGRVLVVLEGRTGGINPAIERGLAAVPAGQPVAVLQGDLPALTPESLDHALELAARHPLAVVPDADGTGTVLLTARGMRPVPRFGPGSCGAHERAGHVVLEIADESPLRRDVDSAEDLAVAALLGLGPATRTVMAAREPGISLDLSASPG